MLSYEEENGDEDEDKDLKAHYLWEKEIIINIAKYKKDTLNY